MVQYPELYPFSDVSIVNPWQAVDNLEHKRKFPDGMGAETVGFSESLEQIAAKLCERARCGLDSGFKTKQAYIPTGIGKADNARKNHLQS